jgi:hypothetical protein
LFRCRRLSFDSPPHSLTLGIDQLIFDLSQRLEIQTLFTLNSRAQQSTNSCSFHRLYSHGALHMVAFLLGWSIISTIEIERRDVKVFVRTCIISCPMCPHLFRVHALELHEACHIGVADKEVHSSPAWRIVKQHNYFWVDQKQLQ